MKKTFIVICMLLSTILVACTNTTESQRTIDNSHFTVISKKKDVSVNDGLIAEDYIVTYTCDEAFTSLTTVFTFYKNDEILFTGTTQSYFTYADTEKQEIASYRVINPNIVNKTTSFAVNFTGKCKNHVNITTYYYVSFYSDSTLYKKIKVEKGGRISLPSIEKDNYIFTGWKTSAGEQFDASKEITSNISLYADLKIDAASLTNDIHAKQQKSIVTIHNMSYKTTLGIETSSYTSQGSGFIFHEQDGYYYVLTNCHVARKKKGYGKQKFTIMDYQGNEYTGYLYAKEEIPSDRAEYDMACLSFKKGTNDLDVLSICKENPQKNDDVISLGSPNGQINSVTFGNVISYNIVTLDDDVYYSDVKFAVIRHDAPANNGSSGGPMLNANLEVVGLIYAGSKDSDGNQVYGYAIPALKIREYLKIYVWL